MRHCQWLLRFLFASVVVVVRVVMSCRRTFGMLATGVRPFLLCFVISVCTLILRCQVGRNIWSNTPLREMWSTKLCARFSKIDEIFCSHFLWCDGMMFTEIICKIIFTCFPVNKEFSLLTSVLHPMESHVHCFCSCNIKKRARSQIFIRKGQEKKSKNRLKSSFFNKNEKMLFRIFRNKV